MSFKKLPQTKPRNPLVAPTLKRKAGRHQLNAKGMRQRLKLAALHAAHACARGVDESCNG
jgi:hypothetical protein